MSPSSVRTAAFQQFCRTVNFEQEPLARKRVKTGTTAGSLCEASPSCAERGYDALTVANFLADKLLACHSSQPEGSADRTELERVDPTAIEAIITVVERVLASHQLSVKQFLLRLFQSRHDIPLQLFVRLDNAGIVFEGVLARAGQSSGTLTVFGSRLWNLQCQELQHTQQSSDATSATRLLERCLAAFISSPTPTVREACSAVLQHLCRQVAPDSEGVATTAWVCETAERLVKRHTSGAATLVALLTGVLSAYLRQQPSGLAQPGRIATPGWVPAREARALCSIYQVTGRDITHRYLAKALTSDDLVSVGVLRAITVLGDEMVDGSVGLQPLLTTLAQSSLDEDNSTGLANVLLAARALTVAGAPTYAEWFASFTAGVGLGEVHSRRSVQLLARTLVILVPLDNLEALHVHIGCVEKQLSGPSHGGVTSVLQDYLDLARTRRADLCSDASTRPTDSETRSGSTYPTEAAANVMRVLRLFAASEVLPKPVLEMSIFRKKYFQQSFLPTLLFAPRAFLVAASAEGHGLLPWRGKLIEALDSKGKIPRGLMSSYRNHVVAESQPTGDGTLGALECLVELEASTLQLAQGARSFVAAKAADDGASSGLLQHCSRRLRILLGAMGDPPNRTKCLDADSMPRLSTIHERAVAILLNMYGRGLVNATSSTLAGPGMPMSEAVSLWTRTFESLLQPHERACTLFMYQLVYLVFSEPPQLADEQLFAVSQLCSSLYARDSTIAHGVTLRSSVDCVPQPALHGLLSCFCVKDAEHMLFSLR